MHGNARAIVLAVNVCCGFAVTESAGCDKVLLNTWWSERRPIAPLTQLSQIMEVKISTSMVRCTTEKFTTAKWPAKKVA